MLGELREESSSSTVSTSGVEDRAFTGLQSELKSEEVSVLTAVVSVVSPFSGVACVDDFFCWAQVGTLRSCSDCTNHDLCVSLNCFDCGFFFSCGPEEHWTKKPKSIWMSCQHSVASVVSVSPRLALCSLA